MSRNEGFDKTKKIIIALVEIGLYHASFILAFYFRYEGELPIFNYIAYDNAKLYIFLAFLLLNTLFGVYIFYNKSKMDLLFLTVIIQLGLMLVVMAMTFFGRWFSFPRSVIVINFVFSSVILFIWRLLVFKLYERVAGTKKVMVVGEEHFIKKAVANFENAKNSRHQITYAVTNHFYEHVKENMDKVDIIYLTDGPAYDQRVEIYELLIRNHKNVFVHPSFDNLALINPNIMNIEDESIIELSPFHISPEYDLVKRLIDFLVALVLILITMPIMAIAGVLVKITSKGPMIYKQVRITKDQKEFNIYKFRTMSATAEKESGPVLASANDMRVTTVGKYLRALRVDELPQLFNVLNGTMSLVGPRPERPFFVEQFTDQNPYYDLRHNVRAGITGYAQVYGKYATDFNSKLNFDLVYIKNYSLLMDVKILLQTLKVLFDKVSSQGVEEEEETEIQLPESIIILD